MMALGSIGFVNPLLLLALAGLPILWWLLRAVPPAPQRVKFPGVRILLGLDDKETTPDKTPWWLLLLRLLAIAAAIFAFARPVLNPESRDGRSGPLLVLMDGGWASAPDWEERRGYAESVLARAVREGRTVALVSLSRPRAEGLTFRDGDAGLERLALAVPAPLMPDRASFAAQVEAQTTNFETVWIHDGLDGDARVLADALRARGPVTMISAGFAATALREATLEDGVLTVTAISVPGQERAVTINAVGPDPSGISRVLGQGTGRFKAGEGTAEVVLEMPLELRNRITRFTLAEDASAGGTILGDDGLRRRKVGLLAAGSDTEGQQLVRPMHYLRKALVTSAEIIEAPLEDILNTAPDMIVLADIGTMAPGEESKLLDWVEEGGLLVRFAGPRLAQSSVGRVEADPLLPVRLRAGGRSVGGAMSWGAPKKIRPFAETSPFFGLTLPSDVDVSTQVMAQPDVDLPRKVMAVLEDGTPLVTGDVRGDGQVILFHVTANAEWSSLPISGLFVEMLDRLKQLAGRQLSAADAFEDQNWVLERVLDGFGALQDADAQPAIEGSLLADPMRTPATPPGIYSAGERRVAVNLMSPDATLSPIVPPSGVTWATMGVSNERELQSVFLMIAILLLGLDILATLWISGRLRTVVTATAVAMLAATMPSSWVQGAMADERAVYATNNTVLGHILTGDARVDGVAEAGLRGLSRVLLQRTAIEPVDPVGVDLETDEIAFYPFLYWPISERQETPSDLAYDKLNAFLRSGGMILFDTRDSHLGGGFSTPNGRVMQRFAEKLDVPPLEPVPDDHVLTRTFYLLQTFPGRWTSQTIWAEAAPLAQEVDGLPFRNLNDGVTPVVIGGNDWAAAWAVNENGQFLFPVGSGEAGLRQREIAYRFGVNLIMHVMTGNYKSDQVHVPALLERLGN